MKPHSLTVLCIALMCRTTSISGEAAKGSALSQVPAPLTASVEDEASIVNENEDFREIQMEKFIPTKEWQEIQPGQHIPKGLHVRINLQTGLKEAKLLDPTEQDGDVSGTKISLPADAIDLEEALKNIATSRDEPSANKEDVTKQLKELKLQFDDLQGIDEIQAAMSAKKIKITTETDMVQELTERLAHIARNTFRNGNHLSPHVESKFNHTGDSGLMIILEDLEYLLHQIDNAQYFADTGGVAMLVNLAESLNITREERSQILLTLGNACSSNQVVSDAAQKANVFRMLKSFLLEDDDNYVGSGQTILRSRALYVLSNIIRSDLSGILWRSFLVDHDGLIIIRSILRNPSAQQKDVIKLYTLLYDVLQQPTLLDIFVEVDSESVNRRTLCEETSRIVAAYNLTLDHTEKLLDFIQSSLDKGFCNASDFHVDQLQDLKTHLAHRFSQEEHREYLLTIDDTIISVIDGLNNGSKKAKTSQRKEEL